ncbi:UNVERIFIED_CONTAM: hypothetical protein GTU68_015942 [Idotea baltica]|nr:hypothetical protein [Idotea baltica]
MEDIEDLFKLESSDAFSSNSRSRDSIVPHVRKRKVTSERSPNDKIQNYYDVPELDSFVPGIQSVYVKTWGCSHNSSDSEYMAGQLASFGYKIVDNKNEADLWLLNSCTVKNPAEDHLRNEVEGGRKAGKKVVVAGCVSQGAPKSGILQGLSIIGVQQIDRVVEVVEGNLERNSVRLLGQKKCDGKKRGGASLLLAQSKKETL